MYTLYSTKMKHTEKVKFMIMAMILYVLHRCLIKTLEFPQSLMIENRKLQHQIKKQNSMFKLFLLLFHTILQCYNVLQNLMEEE